MARCIAAAGRAGLSAETGLELANMVTHSEGAALVTGISDVMEFYAVMGLGHASKQASGTLRLPACLSVCLSVCLCVCVYVCVETDACSPDAHSMVRGVCPPLAFT